MQINKSDDLFRLAVDLQALEAKPTLAKLAAKYKAIEQIAEQERSLDEINDELRRNFDADEARFINGGGAW